MQAFIKDFSKIKSSGVIQSYTGKISGENTIILDFKTSITNDQIASNNYKQVWPTITREMLARNKQALDLLKEGVEIKTRAISAEGEELAASNLNKSNLEELLKLKNENPGLKTKQGSAAEMEQILGMMRKTLPIRNDLEGTTITAIDLEESNKLVYTVVVDDEYADFVGEAAKDGSLKQEVLNNPNLKNVVNGFKRYKLKSLGYIYKNTQGDVLGNVDLPFGEILNHGTPLTP